MPYRKSHPGLDVVITDEALDAFIDGIPLALEEPPARIWPTVLVAAGSAGTVGLVAGVLIAEFVTVTQTLLLVAVLLTVIAAIVFACERERP